ncbi:hypothetical protein [Metaclostridioides mangenotii]|uniref:hypothetical protein n=1 Tax=Metaclostridioides mangenotii TaxID=1540 RepID=UPI000485D916|nr:hypothetical protein [Clostridioides mangenotii]
MARVNNISSLWGRGEKLKTKPFANIECKSVYVSSKYAPSNRSEKKSMLIDAVINAVHEYIELLDGSSKFGAVGRNGNNIYVERSGRNSDSVQLLVYNKITGVCKACNYNINENKVDPYQLNGLPLNEALRDRIQHTEKMDLPPKEIMVQRAMAEVDSNDIELTSKLADAIITLDKTAKANAIRGVAGMRSLFFWLDSILNGESIRESMYHKVIYKMTTDADEIIILEEAVENNTSLFIEPLRRG